MEIKSLTFIILSELFLLATALNSPIPSTQNQTFYQLDILTKDNKPRFCGPPSFLISIHLTSETKSYLGKDPGDASITVCVDPTLFSTKWATHLIEPMGEWSNPEDWKNDFLTEVELQGKKIEDLYQQNPGYKKGLLAPNADFNKHGLHKEMAFHYVNAVPLYQVLGDGNWKILEENLRELAVKTKSKVYVLTGTLGTIGFLDKDVKSPKVNIPEKLYKVVHYCLDRSVHSVVFIADNLPQSVPPTCKDKCGKLLKNFNDAAREKLRDSTRGKIYCCELKDFMENVLVAVPGGAKSVHIMHPEHYSHIVVCGYESQRYLH